MKVLISIAFALVLAPLAALAADNAAPAASGPAPTDTLAPPDCKKPTVSVKVRKADDDSAFQDKMDAYKTCIEAYASAQADLAQRHQSASNNAIMEFNDFVKEVNARKNP